MTHPAHAGDAPITPSTPGRRRKHSWLGQRSLGRVATAASPGLPRLSSPCHYLRPPWRQLCPPPAELCLCPRGRVLPPLRHLALPPGSGAEALPAPSAQCSEHRAKGQDPQSHFLGAHCAPALPRMLEMGGCNNGAVNNCSSLTVASKLSVLQLQPHPLPRLFPAMTCPGFQPAL